MSASNKEGDGCLLLIAAACLAFGIGAICGLAWGFITFGLAIILALVVFG